MLRLFKGTFQKGEPLFNKYFLFGEYLIGILSNRYATWLCMVVLVPGCGKTLLGPGGDSFSWEMPREE